MFWFYMYMFGFSCATIGYIAGAAVTNAKHADNVIDLAAERERRRGKAA